MRKLLKPKYESILFESINYLKSRRIDRCIVEYENRPLRFKCYTTKRIIDIEDDDYTEIDYDRFKVFRKIYRKYKRHKCSGAYLLNKFQVRIDLEHNYILMYFSTLEDDTYVEFNITADNRIEIR